jgi:hypothetical protein
MFSKNIHSAVSHGCGPPSCHKTRLLLARNPFLLARKGMRIARTAILHARNPFLGLRNGLLANRNASTNHGGSFILGNMLPWGRHACKLGGTASTNPRNACLRSRNVFLIMRNVILTMRNGSHAPMNWISWHWKCFFPSPWAWAPGPGPLGLDPWAWTHGPGPREIPDIPCMSCDVPWDIPWNFSWDIPRDLPWHIPWDTPWDIPPHAWDIPWGVPAWDILWYVQNLHGIGAKCL